MFALCFQPPSETQTFWLPTFLKVSTKTRPEWAAGWGLPVRHQSPLRTFRSVPELILLIYFFPAASHAAPTPKTGFTSDPLSPRSLNQEMQRCRFCLSAQSSVWALRLSLSSSQKTLTLAIISFFFSFFFHWAVGKQDLTMKSSIN